MFKILDGFGSVRKVKSHSTNEFFVRVYYTSFAVPVNKHFIGFI